MDGWLVGLLLMLQTRNSSSSTSTSTSDSSMGCLAAGVTFGEIDGRRRITWAAMRGMGENRLTTWVTD